MLAGYDWYVDVDVDNPTSELLSDFPLPLRVSIPTAHLQADGDDIRVTYTNDDAIPYGLKTITTNGSNYDLAIYCKPTSIPTTGLTVRVYYGNASATNGESRDEIGDANTALFMPLGGSGTLDYSDWTGKSTTNHSATSSVGPFGGVSSYDGSSYTAFGSPLSGTGNWSASLWVNSSTPGGSNLHILDIGGSSTDQMLILCAQATGKLRFAIWGWSLGAGQETATTVFDGDWHQVGVTYDGSSLRCYVDGSLDYYGLVSYSGIDIANNAGSIGAYNGGPSNYYQGLAGDLGIASVARSAAWLSAEYHYGLDGSYLSQGSEQPAVEPPVPPVVTGTLFRRLLLLLQNYDLDMLARLRRRLLIGN